MIFALFDYLKYVTRRGRYGDRQKDGGMAVAFVDEIPESTVSQLYPADVIFTQRLDSWKSWAMMYMTSSPVDHVALYVPEGRVAHMTLGGVRTHTLRALTQGARALPVRLTLDPAESPLGPPPGRGKVVPRDRLSHILPARWQLVWVAIRIAHGFHPERFRWKFPFDLSLLAIALDAILWGAFGLLIALPLVGLSWIVVLGNALRFKIKEWRNQPFELLSHPDIGYRYFFRTGGIMFSDIGPLVVSPLGLLPLNVFLTLGRESPNDSPSDELEEFRQGIRDLAEHWGVGPFSEQSENEKCEEDDIE